MSNLSPAASAQRHPAHYSSVHSLLATAEALTAAEAAATIAALPWPTHLRTILPGCAIPSRAGISGWRFQQFDNWPSLCESLADFDLPHAPGLVYLGRLNRVARIHLSLLQYSLGDLVHQDVSIRPHHFALATESLTAGILAASHTEYLSGHDGSTPSTIYQLCAWGM